MPTFSPADASPLLICAITIIVAAAGGLLPFSPIEPVLLLTAIARPALLIPVVALATVSQMSAKAVLFLGSRKAQARLSHRKRLILERIRVRLEGRRGLQVLTVLVSAMSGLPPLYAVTLVCGALRLRLSDYLVAGILGRATRFSALVMLPQLFAAN
jgi:membrane protein YqaA with SNARE-associated domain